MLTPSLNAALLITSHADTLIKGFEGVRLTAYRDGNGIWTIGYGHTGPDVYEGLVWTLQQALNALAVDALTSAHDILDLVTVPLTQNQFDALRSFDYNIGRGHLLHSTVLERLNKHNYLGAADAMMMWIDPGSMNEPGLRRRRSAERALFLTP